MPTPLVGIHSWEQPMPNGAIMHSLSLTVPVCLAPREKIKSYVVISRGILVISSVLVNAMRA